MTIFPQCNRQNISGVHSAQQMDKLHSCSKNQTCLVTQIKCLLYVNRKRKKRSSFYLCSHLIVFFCVTFFSLPVLELQNISVFPTLIMETVPLPLNTKQNNGLAFSNPKYYLDLLFPCCFQVRRVRLMASCISRNKNDNCADFLLIFVLLLRGSAEQCACKS